MVGQLIATFSEGSLGALYTARIISGLGIGATTVIGPVGVVETAPVEFRGLIGAWFNLYMLMGGFVSTFTTLGVYLHVPEGRLQYQIVFFVPIIFSGFHTALSFFVCESPRWLYLSDKHEECIETLQKLRGLPLEDARVQTELKELQRSVQRQRSIGPGIVAAVRQTFLVPSNLRRVQQVVFAYALAQLSGANNITSYLMPILKMIGTGGGPDRSMFISGMYGVSKFFFCMMTSFFFIDALGRRKSMIFGITVQMISDIYIAVFIKCRQDGPTPSASAGKAAIAMIFVHGFGYATGEFPILLCFFFFPFSFFFIFFNGNKPRADHILGLLVLPYVFGAELWPDEIRSFGASFGQLFHWFFYYGLNQGLPSLLSETHNWGAFVFFAAWCFIAGIYTFFVIPETAGRSFEEMEYLFEQPIYKAYRTSKQLEKSCSTSSDMERGVEVDEITDASSSSSGGHEARKGAAIIISQC